MLNGSLHDAVTVLYVRNLLLSTTVDQIRDAFSRAADGGVERVKTSSTSQTETRRRGHRRNLTIPSWTADAGDENDESQEDEQAPPELPPPARNPQGNRQSRQEENGLHSTRQRATSAPQQPEQQSQQHAQCLTARQRRRPGPASPGL